MYLPLPVCQSTHILLAIYSEKDDFTEHFCYRQIQHAVGEVRSLGCCGAILLPSWLSRVPAWDVLCNKKPAYRQNILFYS